MDTRELETYLHEHIPLSKAMAVSVVAAGFDGVTLAAPLAPNINHRDTLFGGSASAIAILAAWTLMYVRLKEAALGGRIVIHANTMHYDVPVAGDFIAIAEAPDDMSWNRLSAAIRRNRKARIHVRARLRYGEQDVGEFEGEFVVLPMAA